MSMTGVMRPGHVQIRVLDIEEAIVHYRDRLGMELVDQDDQGRAYLKCWDEVDKFSIVLREADRTGMDHMAFKVRRVEDLAHFEARLIEQGCNVERIPAGELNGCGERVRFDTPTGHFFDLYAEKEQCGNAVGTLNPSPWPEDKMRGMAAIRFDHCLLYGGDIDGTTRVFTEALDFELAERVVDGDLMIASFMTCSTKAHDIAFVRHSEDGKFHHASFLLGSWEQVLKAADIISMHDISIDIGPTRHGLTRGLTIYFFDPSGNRNEVFTEESYRYPDSPVLTWTADNLGQAIFYHDRKLNENFLGVVT